MNRNTSSNLGLFLGRNPVIDLYSLAISPIDRTVNSRRSSRVLEPDSCRSVETSQNTTDSHSINSITIVSLVRKIWTVDRYDNFGNTISSWVKYRSCILLQRINNQLLIDIITVVWIKDTFLSFTDLIIIQWSHRFTWFDDERTKRTICGDCHCVSVSV